MNQGAVDYLEQNKDKYPKEVLIEELKKAGYSDLDIIDSAKFVFANESIPSTGEQVKTSFWDFKSKKIYTKPSEKWKDFLFGFFAPIVLSFFIIIVSFLLIRSVSLNFLVIILEIISGVYLFNRRRFIFYGIIASFTIGNMLLVIVYISILFLTVLPIRF